MPWSFSALCVPWSILLRSELTISFFGNQPHSRTPPFHCQTKPGLCPDPTDSFLLPWQLCWIIACLRGAAQGAVGGGRLTKE